MPSRNIRKISDTENDESNNAKEKLLNFIHIYIREWNADTLSGTLSCTGV